MPILARQTTVGARPAASIAPGTTPDPVGPRKAGQPSSCAHAGAAKLRTAVAATSAKRERAGGSSMVGDFAGFGG
jgi:hypothetical protein